MTRSLIVVDNFAGEARDMRAVFDERFEDPRSTRADRFVWDYWHVPGQYTAVRTPAWTYFPKRLYRSFHERLVTFGRERLGCHDVSPPWLSLYVDGCRQELHGDLPHGPWAFVVSLTPWRGRVFRGGETLMLRDETLEFWEQFSSVRGVEEREVLRAIEPKFGRLVVFDPRVPHGVREVRGTHDPREGRLVVHGWFVQPRPFVSGVLPTRVLAARIAEMPVRDWIGELRVAGVISFAFDVDRRGRVAKLAVLSDTTRVPRADERERKRLIKRVRDAIARWTFGAQRGTSRVTLPLVFERG